MNLSEILRNQLTTGDTMSVISNLLGEEKAAVHSGIDAIKMNKYSATIANAAIGGYTDNTGNADGNVKLSADHAKNVMMELVILGVAAKRLTAEGYGDKNPVATNETEEGRAQNRRISISVREK